MINLDNVINVYLIGRIGFIQEYVMKIIKLLVYFSLLMKNYINVIIVKTFAQKFQDSVTYTKRNI